MRFASTRARRTAHKQAFQLGYPRKVRLKSCECKNLQFLSPRCKNASFERSKIVICFSDQGGSRVIGGLQMSAVQALACLAISLALCATVRANSVSILIPADAENFDTGVVIGPGQKAIISSGGVWTNGGVLEDYVGPQGFLSVIRTDTIIPSTPLAALIGRTENALFPVGAYAEISHQGRLFLMMNDVPNTYGDNVGYISARINIVNCSGGDCSQASAQGR